MVKSNGDENRRDQKLKVNNYKLYSEPKSFNKIRGVRKKKISLIKRISIAAIAGVITVVGGSIISSFGGKANSKSLVDEEGDNLVVEKIENDDITSKSKLESDISLPVIDHNNYYYVGYDQDIDEVREFLDTTEAGFYIKKYSEIYGIDPHIMAAICKIESLTLNHDDCIPGGRFYTGYGVGITELDFDKEYAEEHEVYVEAINYSTGEVDRVRLNMENAVNLETNIQISAMLFQNNINAMNGNILLAIQCHNFGEPMVRHVLKVNGLYDCIGDFSDLRWLDAMLDAHLHPYNYLSNDEWDYEKLGEYGGKNYVQKVLKFCERDAVYRYEDTIYTVNLNTGIIISTQDVSSRTI